MRRCKYSDAADCSECLEAYCPMDAIDDVMDILGIHSDAGEEDE